LLFVFLAFIDLVAAAWRNKDVYKGVRGTLFLSPKLHAWGPCRKSQGSI